MLAGIRCPFILIFDDGACNFLGDKTAMTLKKKTSFKFLYSTCQEGNDSTTSGRALRMTIVRVLNLVLFLSDGV